MTVMVCCRVPGWDGKRIDSIPGCLDGIGLITVVGKTGNSQSGGARPEGTAFGKNCRKVIDIPDAG